MLCQSVRFQDAPLHERVLLQHPVVHMLRSCLCRGTRYQCHGHCGRTALTIATIPACTAAGRVSHVRTRRARSSDMRDTHMTHFLCKQMLFWCLDMSFCCPSSGRVVSSLGWICWSCVVKVSLLCNAVSSETGGSNPPFGIFLDQRKRYISTAQTPQKPPLVGVIPFLPNTNSPHLNTRATYPCAQSMSYVCQTFPMISA